MKRVIILVWLGIILASCSNNDTANDETMQLSKAVGFKPVQLEVERLDPLHQFKSSAFTKTITANIQVEELLKLIMTLPHFPDGIMHCPADNGVEYKLAFKNKENQVLLAKLRATGCRQVEFNNQNYWAMESKGNEFMNLLIKSLELTDEEFRGL